MVGMIPYKGALDSAQILEEGMVAIFLMERE